MKTPKIGKHEEALFELLKLLSKIFTGKDKDVFGYIKRFRELGGHNSHYAKLNIPELKLLIEAIKKGGLK